jgi:hypothetical protein
MDIFRRQFSAFSEYSKFVAWAKVIFVTAGFQVIVQSCTLAGGVLIIRLLPTQEYALYTLANTMLGAAALLTDGGITIGVLAQAGKVWQSREKLGVVIATGLALRRQFASVGIFIIAPLLLYTLIHHGATLTTALLLSAALIPTFLTSLSGSLLEVSPKVHQDIIPIQRIQIGVGFGRLITLALALFALPVASIAIISTGLAQIWGNIKLRKLADNYTDRKQLPDAQVRHNIIAQVKRILPGAIYYGVSGQITIWLASFLGSTLAIAQIGALSRIAIVMNVFTIMFASLIVPRFARLAANKKLLLNHYLKIHLLLAFVSATFVSCAYIFSHQLLWIIGAKYANLSSELILNIIGSSITLIAGSSFLLFSARGWAANPLITITIEIVAVVVGIYFINVSTIRGLFLLNIFIALIQLCINFFYGFYKISKLPVESYAITK